MFIFSWPQMAFSKEEPLEQFSGAIAIHVEPRLIKVFGLDYGRELCFFFNSDDLCLYTFIT